MRVSDFGDVKKNREPKKCLKPSPWRLIVYDLAFSEKQLEVLVSPGLKDRNKKHERARGSYRSNDEQLNSAAAAARPELQMGKSPKVRFWAPSCWWAFGCTVAAPWRDSYTSAASAPAPRREDSSSFSNNSGIALFLVSFFPTRGRLQTAERYNTSTATRTCCTQTINMNH